MMLSSDIKVLLEDAITNRTPSAIILREANPLDYRTPTKLALTVCGWGRSSKAVTYDLPGWDQIRSDIDDEYFIVYWGEEADQASVVRPTTKMDLLFWVTNGTIDVLADELANEF